MPAFDAARHSFQSVSEDYTIFGAAESMVCRRNHGLQMAPAARLRRAARANERRISLVHPPGITPYGDAASSRVLTQGGGASSSATMTRRDAASPWFIRLASHPKETHRPGASRRRGETPHLLESSLIAICDQASNGKQHDETPTVHKTPSLPLRHELRAPQPSASDTKRRSLPWRRGFQPRQICRVAQGGPSLRDGQSQVTKV